MSLVAAALMALLPIGTTGASSARCLVLHGRVESNGDALRGYEVSLYAGLIGGHRPGPDRKLLGVAITNRSGDFRIAYSLPIGRPGQIQPLLFAEAVHGLVMLATAIDSAGHIPRDVVVNERTTVATGNAFAQFIHGSKIEGNTYGMGNAVHMAANLANPQSGDVGVVLALSPNATETSTLATFNSLTNAVASCVAVANNCAKLFEAATPPGGPPPTNVLQAVANIVKNPSYLKPNGTPAPDDPLFDLSEQREIYSPFLTERPTNWLLFLKITGGFYSAQDQNNLLNGPANFAIDKRGSVWVANNYIPEPPNETACAGNQLSRFTPWGAVHPGSPYFGGGVGGAGYGITFDPSHNLWTANFGFQDPPCASTPEAATSDSVSLFSPHGAALSPSTGYTSGDISWPQGVVSDRLGNIFVANCGNDSITEIPGGDTDLAFNIKLKGASQTPGAPQVKPFGIALDLSGNAWITDNFNNTVSIVSPSGHLLNTLPGTYLGKTVLTHPVGDTVDSKGNIWVANSDWLDVPCPDTPNVGGATNPSITLYPMNTRAPYKGSPFTGGGLTVPWGIAVDGNDSVWVFNFGSIPPDPTACAQTGVNQFACGSTGISHFCGSNTRSCPAGLQYVGAPISPKDTGYQSNALMRITGGPNRSVGEYLDYGQLED